MGKTGYLHYRVRLDNNNEVMIQNKLTVDSESWSNPQYIWNVGTPRPEGRECIGKTSGLLIADLQLAPSKKLTAQLQTTLDTTSGLEQKRSQEPNG